MFGFGFPKTLQSGSEEFPTRRSLIQHMVTELIASKRWEWVTFELRAKDPVVEVAHDVNNQVLEIYIGLYPFPKDFTTVFANWGIELPADWWVHKFSKTNWLGPGFLVLATAVTDQDRVIEFADRVLSAIAGPHSVHQLKAYFQ